MLKSFFLHTHTQKKIDSSNDSLSASVTLAYNTWPFPLQYTCLQITAHKTITRRFIEIILFHQKLRLEAGEPRTNDAWTS